MKLNSFLAALTAVILSSEVNAAGPDFDPHSFRDKIHGETTKVLVLGAMHLSGAGDDFDKKNLKLLLAKLEAFKPDVIAVENLPGESVYALKAYDAIYEGSAEQYGKRILEIAGIARASTGLDMPAAEAEARKMLAANSARPTTAERRKLAAAFAASGDPYSALVQLKQLKPGEVVAKDWLSDELIGKLNEFADRKNESQLIGVELAARLGLEEIHPMDDHGADDVVLKLNDALEAALSSDPSFEELRNDPVMKKANDSVNHLRTAEETLETFRMLNSPEMVVADPGVQWLYWLTREWPANLGRKRMAEWEARNLRMAGNIRESMVDATGGRVLVIVGGAHKAYLDAYLDMIHDVEIVDALEVLK